MMSNSPCSSATIHRHVVSDDPLFVGDENDKFVQPTTSYNLNHLATTSSVITTQGEALSQMVSSTHQSQTYKHFLAQKYAAESTSDGDCESHQTSQSPQQQQPKSSQRNTFPSISSFHYPFSPLVSSSSNSHLEHNNNTNSQTIQLATKDNTGIVLESSSSIDSLQVESTSTNNSGHTSSPSSVVVHHQAQTIFTDGTAATTATINDIDSFIKQQQQQNSTANMNSGVTSSSTRPSQQLCGIELTNSNANLFADNSIISNNDDVDSTTTVSISTSTNLNSANYVFNNFPPTIDIISANNNNHQQSNQHIVTYSISPTFSSTLLQQLEQQSHLQLPPSLSSPNSIHHIDQYFNNTIINNGKRDELLNGSSMLDNHHQQNNHHQQFVDPSNGHMALLGDSLTDSFLQELPTEPSSFGNDENEITQNSINHENVIINDLPVLTRARASMPIDYLCLQDTASGGVGTFARKPIPKRSQFGPIEGMLYHFSENELSIPELVQTSKNNLMIFVSDSTLLSQSDENNSNWTRFVRPATNVMEQNLELIQREYAHINEIKFFYYTTRDIMPNEELKVWYSKEYRQKFKIPNLLLDQDGMTVVDDLHSHEQHEQDLLSQSDSELSNNLNAGGHKLRNKIAKSQLTQLQQIQSDKDGESENPQQHELMNSSETYQLVEANDHTASVGSQQVLIKINESAPSMVATTVSNNGTGTATKTNQYQCPICQRIFPRHYSLRRHLVMHSGVKRYKCPICDMAFNHVYNRNRHVKKHNRETATNGNNVANKKESTICVASKSAPIAPNTNGQQQQTVFVKTISNGSNISSKTTVTNDNNNNFIIEAKQNQLIKEEVDTENGTSSSILAKLLDQPIIEHNPQPQQLSLESAYQQQQLEQPSSSQKMYRCTLCYKRFSSMERLEKHGKVHDESAKHLSCGVCKRKFLTNSALTCHMKSHSLTSNEPRKYDCTLCGELFDSIQSRRDHVTVHKNPNTGLYHCSKCSKTFDDFSPIRKHIKSFHSDEIFPCSECDKVFPRQDKLRLHMLCHSDRWEFQCNFCEKQFKRKDKLKEHTQRMHAPDRDVRIAAKLAARMQRIKSQRTKKIATKPSQPNYHEFVYKCHQCLLGFKRRGMLVNHLAKRHPDVPYNTVPELTMPIVKTSKDYYCQYCEKVYKSSSKRKAHIIKNHPGKTLPPSNRNKTIPISGAGNPTFSATVGSIMINPHFCEWCHKQYASKAKLMQHQRKKHPDRIQNSSSSSLSSSVKMEKSSDLSFNSTSTSSQSSMLDDPVSHNVDATANNNHQQLSIVDSIDNSTNPEVKIEHDESVTVSIYKNDQSNKLDPFLTNTMGNSLHESFIDTFELSDHHFVQHHQSSMKNQSSFLSNNGNHLQSNQFIDSTDPLDDLLNITIVEEPSQNIILNSSSSNTGTISNNIITILACTVPQNCTTFSANDLADFSGNLSDIIQLTSSDFTNGKLLGGSLNSSINPSNSIGVIDHHHSTNNNETNDLITDQITENGVGGATLTNWSQVCEELAMV